VGGHCLSQSAGCWRGTCNKVQVDAIDLGADVVGAWSKPDFDSDLDLKLELERRLWSTPSDYSRVDGYAERPSRRRLKAPGNSNLSVGTSLALISLRAAHGQAHRQRQAPHCLASSKPEHKSCGQ
jgi:hypothetical protein